MVSASQDSLSVTSVKKSLGLIPQDALLPDPLGDRQCKWVPSMPNKRLTLEQLSMQNGASGIDHELIKAY